MLTMGNTHSVRKINFEDMQDMIRDDKTIIVNTLDISNQECLIKKTISASHEVNIINKLIKSDYTNRVVIYGMNSADESIVRKYNQLTSLGLINIVVYPGGLFEWLLLQDVYGMEDFPTTNKELDILKYKGKKLNNHLMLTN
jgi:hypothetical protein